MEENEKKALLTLKKELQELRAEYDRQMARFTAPEAAAPREENDEGLRTFLRAQEDWLNEYVEIRLFKDNEKYKDDVYVAINGKNCVIRRGVWTRIRRKFALLLDQSEIQDLRTAELMEREAGRFAGESRRRGV
ncbi:MAG: hypothetical protein IJA78_06785 [Clostridia bacterium]|nr:hypothetical protein [Clostridia bacterium]